jgi:prevent-host-death family protein
MMAKSEGARKNMQTVNIAELKNNLSHYLRQVRQGNEITIKDRNRVIARIVPAAPSANYDEELLELAAQGKVKLPEIPPTAEDLAKELKRKLPRMKSKGEKAKQVMKRIWEEERGDY